MSNIPDRIRPTMTYVGPPTWARVLTTAIVASIAVLGVFLAFVAPSTLVLGFVFFLTGVALAIRVARIGIVLSGDHLTIRGVISSRSLPKQSIIGVDRLPFIDWRDGRGITHASFVYAVAGASNGRDPNARMRQKATEQLSAWLADGERPQPSVSESS